MNRRSLLLALLSASFVQMGLALAAAAQAQEAIERGIQAGKQNDHLKAIEYFQEARKANPDVPEAYFYLGVAESKIPGRELRSIAWFGTYLTARPNAPNAAAVRKQIEDLKLTQQNTLVRLIQLAEKAAIAYDASWKWGEYSAICAGLWAKAGDYPAAFKAVDQLHGRWKQDALASITYVQTRAGQFSAAKSTLGMIEDADLKYDAQITLVIAQADAGDVTSAREMFKSMSKEPECKLEGFKGHWDRFMSAAASAIARAQAKAGNIAGGRDTIKAALKTAEAIKNLGHREDVQQHLAIAQAENGDIAAALVTTDQIGNAATQIEALVGIASFQAKSGDIVGAKESLKRAQSKVEKTENKSFYEHYVPEMQKGILGAPMSFYEHYIPEMQKEILGAPGTARVQVSGSARLQVANWTALLDDSNSKNGQALNLQEVLFLPGYLDSMPPPKKLRDAVENSIDFVRRVIARQKGVYQLLKRQAEEQAAFPEGKNK